MYRAVMPRVVNVSKSAGNLQVDPLPAQETNTINLQKLNSLLTCPLCTGYLISATTLVECGHSFCRSCLFAYSRKVFKDNKILSPLACPICNTTQNLFLTRPQDACKPDHVLQNLVYKIVPGLLTAEVDRKKNFAALQLADAAVEHSRSVSVSLEFLDRSCQQKSSDNPVSPNNSILNDIGVSQMTSEAEIETFRQRRMYLRLPSKMSIRHLKKFITARFSFSTAEEIIILSSIDEEILDLLLIGDVAFLLDYDEERGPIRLFFCTTRYKGSGAKRKLARTPDRTTRNSPVTNRRRRLSVGTKEEPRSSTPHLPMSSPLSATPPPEAKSPCSEGDANKKNDSSSTEEERLALSPVLYIAEDEEASPKTSFQSFADPEKPKLLLRRISNTQNESASSAISNSGLPESDSAERSKNDADLEAKSG